MQVIHASNPTKEDIDYLTKMINKETLELGEAYPFAFFIRDERNKIIAGCNGYIVFGCIYTDQLWVDSGYRNQGFAKNLMEKVHKHGSEEGCSMAALCTMSFQNSINFYKKMGYKVDFERQGYTEHASCFFLRKNLLT